ncbi:unnamed protein product [Arabis nemorensis]|uniref:F-box domain-containing protein n=1 Tax=Arabis nemorensis TaxID=586526 RepID=A0A565BYX5_9BRAS|nr:unnamed protein product [Arabis nemorensis]
MKKYKNIHKSITTSVDINEEILQYLPMKSLARFKVVSKQWRSTVESTYFAHKRLVRFGLPTPNVKLLIVHSKFNEDLNSTTLLLNTFSRDHNNKGEICLSSSSSYTFPDNPIDKSQDKTIQVLGSCDGLVLVRIHKDFRYIHLINPTTREHQTLSPEPSENELRYKMPFTAGFGKDVVTRSR